MGNQVYNVFFSSDAYKMECLLFDIVDSDYWWVINLAVINLSLNNPTVKYFFSFIGIPCFVIFKILLNILIIVLKNKGYTDPC